MEYKGFKYDLVQTIMPSGWRWTFVHLDHEFSDTHLTRHEGIRSAQRAIDTLISLELTLHN